MLVVLVERGGPRPSPKEVAVGWWPGDHRHHPRAAFYGYAHPAPDGYAAARLDPPAARWEPALEEFVLDWDDLCRAADPHAAALGFLRSLARHSCAVCRWDPALAGSVDGMPAPVR